MKIVAVLVLVAGSLMAEPGVTWEHSLAAAQKRARQEHKLIFLDIWTDWCGWCKRLQKDSFPKPEAQRALAKVVPLSIMTQDGKFQPTENSSFETKYGISGYPTLLILDEEGREVARQPGYLDAKALATWIDQVRAGRK